MEKFNNNHVIAYYLLEIPFFKPMLYITKIFQILLKKNNMYGLS